MSTSTLDRYSNSSLKSEVFTTSAISQLFRQRSTATDSIVHTPLSVGQKGVTPQLDNVAKSQQTGGRKLVKKGDIVINSRSDRRGASGLSDRDGSVSLIYIVLKPNLEKINPEFAHHLIRSKGFQEEFYRFGTGIVADLWSTRYERMAQIRVPLPPMETQQRIADYLDRETAEIDAVVADLDRYVELLEKRRRVMIAQSVTRGIGSDRTRVHPRALPGGQGMSTDAWDMVPLALVAQVTLGKMVQNSASELETVEQPYLHAANVRDFGVLDTDHSHRTMWFSPSEVDSLKVKSGDVVVVEGGAVGKSAYVKNDLPGYGFQNSILRVRAKKRVSDGRFIQYSLQSAYDSGEISRQCSSVSLAHFPAEKIKRFRVPYPSLETQQRIADYLDRETTEIDSLIAKSTKLRDLLLKRRSVLVTEVVTGRKQV